MHVHVHVCSGNPPYSDGKLYGGKSITSSTTVIVIGINRSNTES